MKNFIGQLLFSSTCYSLMYAAFFLNIEWAGNVLLFLLVILGSLSIICPILARDKLVEELKEKDSSLFLRWVGRVSTLGIIAMLVIQGWLFVAALILLAALFSLSLRIERDKKYGKPKLS